MGNGHYKQIRVQEPIWPEAQSLKSFDALTLALYAQGPVDLAAVTWLDAGRKAYCSKCKCVGVYSDGELVGIIQHRFGGVDTNVYVAGVPRETVWNGAVGENLTTYDASILRIDAMLARARKPASAPEGVPA